MCDCHIQQLARFQISRSFKKVCYFCKREVWSISLINGVYRVLSLINGVDASHSKICPRSSLDSKLNFSSCIYSRDFYTWNFLSLCVCVIFFLCRCWCFFVLQEQRQRVKLSGSLLVVDKVRPRGFQNTRPQELSASPFQRYDGCIRWLNLILQPLHTFVELARCERVMTTRA